MICPWCVLAHIICTSMSIPRTIQLERMTHMYVHTRYQVCTYVLHLYTIIPTAVLYLLVVSFQTFGNTKYRTQPLQHSYEPTPTAPSKVSSEWSVICYAHLVLHWVGPPATCVLVRGREPLLALDQLDKLQEERVRQTKVGSKLLRRDARGIREVFILQQLRPTTRAAVSPLPRAARELHTRRVLVHVVVEVLAFDLFESGQSYSQSSSWQEVIDTAHCGHRMLVRASHGHGQTYRYATLTRGEQQQQ